MTGIPTSQDRPAPKRLRAHAREAFELLEEHRVNDLGVHHQSERDVLLVRAQHAHPALHLIIPMLAIPHAERQQRHRRVARVELVLRVVNKLEELDRAVDDAIKR